MIRREKTERDTVLFIVLLLFFSRLFLTWIIRCLEFKQQTRRVKRPTCRNGHRCYYMHIFSLNSCVNILADEWVVCESPGLVLCNFLPVHIGSENFIFHKTLGVELLKVHVHSMQLHVWGEAVSCSSSWRHKLFCIKCHAFFMFICTFGCLIYFFLNVTQ